MSMVCGLDLHRQQITFDALEDLFRRAGVDSSWTRPGAPATVSDLK